MSRDPQSIVASIEAAPASQSRPRRYIGASAIGNSCMAYLSLSLRGFPDDAPDRRLGRIFRDGHRLEDQIIQDIKGAGHHVMEVDPLTGKQWAYSMFGGHVSGHGDGLLELPGGEVVYLEIKSMNDSKFKECVRSGVRISHPLYFAQLQFMMGLAKLSNAYLVAYNKNDGTYYAEMVAFDEFAYYGLVDKAERVLDGEGQRQADDHADWRCKGCFKRSACWKDEAPVETRCSTCAHSKADKHKGTWWCAKHEKAAVETCADYERWKPTPKQP